MREPYLAMLRRTVFSVAALLAFGVAIGAWAADDSFFFVIDDQAGSISHYAWLDPLPEPLASEVALAQASAVELRRSSTPERRFILFQSRSCPPLIEITTAKNGAIRVAALDPRVDWRCGGYAHTYVLELRLDPAAPLGDLTIVDRQTSQSLARP